MAPSGSQILVWVEPPSAYIRLVGRATVEGARNFKTLIHRLDSEGIRHFCLDLGECRIMDSTFSGILAALATDLGAVSCEPGCSRFTLTHPNDRVRDLLDNLGVIPLVNLLEGAVLSTPGGEVREVSLEKASKEEITRCCLEAHRFLMALKPENQARFSEVTRLLEKDLTSAS